MLLYKWLNHHAKKKGGAKALFHRDTYHSWRALLHRVDRRASELKSIGIRPGDWVGLMLGNVPDFVFLSFALSKINAAPIPLDPTTSTRDLELLMSVAPLRGLITRPRGGDAPLPPVPGGKKKGAKRQALESKRRLQGTLLSCSIYPVEPKPPPDDEQTICAVLCTSDASGDPKPVERTEQNLAAEAEHLIGALNLTDEDRVLLTVPLFNSFGFDVGLIAALAAGSSIYLEDDVASNRILKLIREHKITLFPGSLTLFEEMARLPTARPLGFEPARLISSGGGLTGTLAEHFYSKLGVRPIACFHSTETGTISMNLEGDAGNTVGPPLEGVEVRITNVKTGKPVAKGRKGSLWVRSKAISPLKFSAPVKTKKETPVGHTDAEGWFRTGDLASMDRFSRLRILEREDGLVRVDGKRVALCEVKSCIESYPKVSEAEAMVISDPLGGPMVVARVVLKGKTEISAEEIIDHCARNLSPYKVPRRIEICKSL